MTGFLLLAMASALAMGLRAAPIFLFLICLAAFAVVCAALGGYKQAITYVVLTQGSYVVGLFIIGAFRHRR